MLPFERQIMDALLAGEHPYLAALRAQLDHTAIRQRTVTDAGFSLGFEVSTPELAFLPNLMIDDVSFRVYGLDEPVFCVLWTTAGTLDQLECYGAGDHWPEFPVVEKIEYLEAIPRSSDTWSMVPTSNRHLPSLVQRWMSTGTKA